MIIQLVRRTHTKDGNHTIQLCSLLRSQLRSLATPAIIVVETGPCKERNLSNMIDPARSRPRGHGRVVLVAPRRFQASCFGGDCAELPSIGFHPHTFLVRIAETANECRKFRRHYLLISPKVIFQILIYVSAVLHHRSFASVAERRRAASGALGSFLSTTPALAGSES